MSFRLAAEGLGPAAVHHKLCKRGHLLILHRDRASRLSLILLRGDISPDGQVFHPRWRQPT